jgi:hypothetical protein
VFHCCCFCAPFIVGADTATFIAVSSRALLRWSTSSAFSRKLSSSPRSSGRPRDLHRRVNCTIMKDPLCGDDSFEMKLVIACCVIESCKLSVTPCTGIGGAAGGQVPVQGRLMIPVMMRKLCLKSALCSFATPAFASICIRSKIS